MSQTQSADVPDPPYSGLVGTINQDSSNTSTANATQNETQCEDAVNTATVRMPASTCATQPITDTLPSYSLTQTQYGPEGVFKAPASGSHGSRPLRPQGLRPVGQTGNSGDLFFLNQTSKQDTDGGPHTTQKNIIVGDCTSGTVLGCQAGQTATLNGLGINDGYTSPTITGLTINCSNGNGSCSATPPPVPTITSPAPTSPTESRSATFTWTDPATAGVTYYCSNDGGAHFTPCDSLTSTSYSNLPTGSHTFEVTASDGHGNTSAPASSSPWTIVDANISLSPATATNEVGTTHTVTCTIKQDIGDGHGFKSAPNNTPCNWSITTGPNHTQSGSCNTSGTGTCQFTYNGTGGPGTDTIHATTTFTVNTVLLTRSTLLSGTDIHGDGTNVAKTWVDARIKIEGTATNEVGSAHTFTVTFEQNAGTGWSPVVGKNPTVSISPTPGSVTDNCASTGTDASGVCTVQINSSSPGVFTANASGSVTVGGVPLTRDTDSTTPAPCGGGVSSCGPAVKTYVDARIKIEGTATNEVGSAHTFTVTFEQNAGTGWSPVVGKNPTVSISPTPGSVTDNCASTGTDASGVCTVQINSSSPGVFTANASGSVTVGGVPLTRDTDSTTPAPCGGGVSSCGPAVKTYVDARIKIEGTATNEVGSAHTFTVTFEQNAGTGWSPVVGKNPTVSISPTPGSVTDNCASTGTDASGVCTVQINSSSPGVFTANASGSVTVGGVPLTRDTDSTTPAPCGGGVSSCGPAVKTYVDARIKIEGTATNEVGSAHTFTVTFEQNAGTGWSPVVGKNPTVSISPTPGSVTDNCASTGTDASGVCTVQINSSSPGVFTANASGSVTVGGVPLTRDTDSTTPAPCGGGVSSCGPAVKTYVLPTPVIDTGASNGNIGDALFTFHDSDASLTFVCSTDGISYSACSGPGPGPGSQDYPTPPLSPPADTFYVEATDGTNTSQPATWSWTEGPHP